MTDHELLAVESVAKTLTILRKEPAHVAQERLEQMNRGDKGFYERYRYEKTTGRPAPRDEPEAPLEYADILKAVELRASQDGSTLDAAWCWLLDAHPDDPVYRAARRRWQLYDRIAALDKADRETDARPRLTPAQIKAIVKAMPDPDGKPSMDFMRLR
jgi:hypothetical protein